MTFVILQNKVGFGQKAIILLLLKIFLLNKKIAY